jgi:hypothetical protein
MAKTDTQTATANTEAKKLTKIPTRLNHVFLIDPLDNGQLREVAVVKEDENGSLYYIDIALLDQVDKARLKGLVTSQHADKYALWDLMSQVTLSNGKNALDYFHQITKTKLAPGTVNTALGGGLMGVRSESNAMVGSGFTDPAGAVINS